MSARTLESTVAWGLILAWATSAAAQSVDLRPKFTTGRVTYYREISNGKSKEGRRRSQKSTIKKGFRCAVQDVHPDGSAELEITLLYVAASGGTPQSPLKFDSRRSKGSPPSSNHEVQFLNMLVDKPLVLSVAADGTIDRLTGFEQIDRIALGAFWALVSPEERLRAQYDNLFATRKAPVPTEVDAKWEDESTPVGIPLFGGAFNAIIQYTLKSVDLSTQRAKIVMDDVLRWEESESAGPVTVSLEDSKASGRITWDLAAGELVKATYNSQATVTVIGYAFGGLNQQKDSPVKFTWVVRTTLKRVKLTALRLPTEKAKRGRKREGK